MQDHLQTWQRRDNRMTAELEDLVMRHSIIAWIDGKDSESRQ